MGKRRDKNGLFMEARRKFEKEFLKQVITSCNGNKMEAARRLGISYATLKIILKEDRESDLGEFEAVAKALREEILARILDQGSGVSRIVEIVELAKNAARKEVQAIAADVLKKAA